MAQNGTNGGSKSTDGTLGRSHSLGQRIEDELRARAAKNRLRRLKARDCNEPLVDLSNNDYLRLSQHPEVIAAAHAALELWGASASASPLISGYTAEHAALEQDLAEWFGFSHALLWNSGYAANAAVLGGLPKKGDLVLADRLIHNSMVSGILRSGARLSRYRHLDVDHLETLLQREQGRCDGTIFVVTETVFSMDGDFPDLAKLAALKTRHDFVWIVDEAHATGWYGAFGSGLVEAADLSAHVDVLVGTLGKALGSGGAFTLFREECVRDYFINTAGEFIYSTFFPPASAAAARAAIGVCRRLYSERANWHTASRTLRKNLRAHLGEDACPLGDSPIVPVIVGDDAACLRAAERLRERGWRIGAIRPPTVPEGGARLRLSLNRTLSEAQLNALVTDMVEVLPEARAQTAATPELIE